MPRSGVMSLDLGIESTLKVKKNSCWVRYMYPTQTMYPIQTIPLNLNFSKNQHIYGKFAGCPDHLCPLRQCISDMYPTQHEVFDRLRVEKNLFWARILYLHTPVWVWNLSPSSNSDGAPSRWRDVGESVSEKVSQSKRASESVSEWVREGMNYRDATHQKAWIKTKTLSGNHLLMIPIPTASNTSLSPSGINHRPLSARSLFNFCFCNF